MADLRGVSDDKAIPIKCPKCGQLLLFVNDMAAGRIYPFCKKCHSNCEIILPLNKTKK